MNIDIHLQFAFYLILVSVISGSFGYFVAALFLSSRQNRIQQDTWNQARVFYTRKKTERGL